MKTCYNCKFFDKALYESQLNPQIIYACDSTDYKVSDHISRLKIAGTDVTPENVAVFCPSYTEKK